jgi:membrane protease YdiL (CAAX protease family)
MATVMAQTGQPPVSSPARAGDMVQKASAWWWGVYLVAIIVAELITSLGRVELGIVVHLVLLLTIPIHAMFVAPPAQGFLIGLVLAPLIRIVSLAMPLAGLSPVNQHLLTSVPLAVAALAAMQVIGLSPRDVGLRLSRLPLQLAIGLLGLPIGVLVYAILQPAPIVPDLSWRSAVLPVAVFLVSIGLLEELVFRGILQTLGQRTLGELGIGYVSVVFAALQIGYLSPPHTGLVFMVALLFAWLVARTRSILGVSLAHGLTNVVVYMLFPLLAVQGGWALPDVSWTGYARSGGPDSPPVSVQVETTVPPGAIGPTPVSRQATPEAANAPVAPVAATSAPSTETVPPMVPTSVAAVAPTEVPPVATVAVATSTPVPAQVAEGIASPEPSMASGWIVVSADGGANVRAEPSLEDEILATIPTGSVIEVVGVDRTVAERTWRNVQLSDGQRGWIDVTLTEPAAPPSPAAPAIAPSPAAAAPVAPSTSAGVVTVSSAESSAVTHAAPTAAEAVPTLLPSGPAASAASNAPVQSVVRLYDALARADYDTLVSLWSDRMRGLVNLDVEQLKEHAPSQDLVLQRADLASIDRERGEAIVDVEVLETLDSAGGLKRRYVGTWRLVAGPSGWLLDEPRIQIQQ